MSGIKKILALLITCTLLIAAAPMAGAATATDVVGTWKGTNIYYTMTITFNADNTYDTIIEQNGQQYPVYGTFSMDGSYFYFLPNGGQLSGLTYFLSGDRLTLSDPRTGETIVLNRQWTYTPAIPEGMVGIWTGVDQGRTIYCTLKADGGITIAYDHLETVSSAGTFTVENGLLEAQFPDDTYLSLKFILVGNTLILADEEQGLTVTLTRYVASPPTPLPVVTQPPQVTAAPTPLPAPTAVPTTPASPGLIGTWLGNDATGALKLVLTAEGTISLSYEGDAASVKSGQYIADGSTLTVVYDDGTTEIFRYILMGDTLLLTDSQLGGAVTMTRQEEPVVPAGSVDLALLGTWGGLDNGTYLEVTFTQAGEVTVFVPSDPDSGGTGSYSAFQGKISARINAGSEDFAYGIQGDTLTLTRDQDVRALSRKSGPLIRLTLPEQAAAATVDAALVGTWGGMEGDVYAEITLYADGTYEKFVPQDESQNGKGTYMAQNGMLAVLLPGGALQGAYVLEDHLTLTWAGKEPLTLKKMPGHLTRASEE